MGIVKQFYEYQGRLCAVKSMFNVEVKGFPKIYAAAIFVHDGECFIAEWASLKAKPLHKTAKEWELEHEPIEFFGASISERLAKEGYSKMEDIAKLDGKDLKAIKGIGDKALAVIAIGLKEWKDVSVYGQLFNTRNRAKKVIFNEA